MSKSTEEETLGKRLGEIIGVALVNMTKDHRWYTNWRTRDEYDQWTKEDFRQLEWKGNGASVGAFGTAAIDFIIEVKLQMKLIIEQEVAKREEQWFQWMINEVGYEKARAYKDIVTLNNQTKEPK